MSKNHRRSQGRRRPLFRRSTPPGADPGSLAADPASQRPVVRVLAWRGEALVERECRSLAEIEALRSTVNENAVTWIDVRGMGDVEWVSRLGQTFGLHPLALEDVVNHHQRSKVEPYGEQLFIVARMLEGTESLESDQLGMFLGGRFLITFQHTAGDCLDPLRERIRRSQASIRSKGADYLAYAILDAVVDSYFPLLESLGERIETLEDDVVLRPDHSLVARIHQVKSQLLALRRAIWPLREALHVLIRDAHPLIQEETRIHLRDCADHTFQIMDLVDTFRELASDLLGLYHSAIANRMNEVMQVLTVIATIFIPLTFIVGVYGMNFSPDSSPWNMPELRWYWGYVGVWVVMLSIAAGMLLLFYRRGWLPRSSVRR